MAFLVDEDFNHRIVRGLLRRNPHLNLVTVPAIPSLAGRPDPDVLEWAASENRSVLTHDENTMTLHAGDRIASGLPMPGLVVVPQSLAIGRAIDEILLLDGASLDGEWAMQILFLPLQ
jgi:hypothetical protein